MSIKLMTLVFDADIPDLEYTKKNKSRKTKASTATLVLLAYADHANEYGEGTYPGYKRLLRKTKLSPQGLADTIEALKQNNILSFQGRSKLNTNSYNISIEVLQGFLKSLESGFSSDLNNPLKSLEYNPQDSLKVKPYDRKKGRQEAKERKVKQQEAKADGLGAWLKLQDPEKIAEYESIQELWNRLESALAINVTANQRDRDDWKNVIAYLLGNDKQGKTIEKYAEWAKAHPYDAPTKKQMANQPWMIQNTFPAAFENMKQAQESQSNLDNDGWGDIDYTTASFT